MWKVAVNAKETGDKVEPEDYEKNLREAPEPEGEGLRQSSMGLEPPPMTEEGHVEHELDEEAPPDAPGVKASSLKKQSRWKPSLRKSFSI